MNYVAWATHEVVIHGCFCRTRVRMEFRTPRLTDVLSTPVPIQLLLYIPFLVNTSLNMVSAVPELTPIQ